LKTIHSSKGYSHSREEEKTDAPKPREIIPESLKHQEIYPQTPKSFLNSGTNNLFSHKISEQTTEEDKLRNDYEKLKQRREEVDKSLYLTKARNDLPLKTQEKTVASLQLERDYADKKIKEIQGKLFVENAHDTTAKFFEKHIRR
jgi:phosphoglycolate phosphatase-like HAD superfamily hydrolase